MRGGPSPRVDFAGALRTRAEAVSARHCGASEPKALSALLALLLPRQNRPVLADARRVAGVKRAVLQAVCPNSRVFKFLGDAAISAARLSGSTAYPSPSSREESRSAQVGLFELRTGQSASSGAVYAVDGDSTRPAPLTESATR